MRLDNVNRQILEYLQTDARTSTAIIARAVNRAESTVRERMIGMERAGLIRGYSAILDPSVLGYEAYALVRATCDLKNIQNVVQKLRDIPQVTRAVLTTGRNPLVFEIVAENLSSLDKIIETRIATEDFVDLEPVVVLRDLIDRRHVPVFVSNKEKGAKKLVQPAGDFKRRDPEALSTI